MDVQIDEAKEALERVFGFAEFRPGQQEVLETVFAGDERRRRWNNRMMHLSSFSF